MTIKQIDKIIEDDNSLKIVAQAYSEIANSKVKRIRLETERNRVFLEEIGKAYALVRFLAIEKKISIAKPKQTACVLITSNNRFYGAIDSDLIKFFTEKTMTAATDKIIIGKMGIEHFKTVKTFKFQPMVLKRDQPNNEELKQLVDLIKDYNQVFVFYSQMQSLLVQTPKVLDLTKSKSVYSKHAEGSKFRFVFEPELAKILAFFDSQVLDLLLEGAFLESELARTASRFISMDEAESSADKLIREYKKLRAYTKRALENNLILESFAASYARKEG